MKQVSILGTPYTIEYVSSDNSDLDGNAGRCFLLDKTILIDEEMDERIIKKTLIHEVIHAFMEESGFNAEVDNLTEEMWVDWYAMQFDKINEVISKL